MSFTESNVMSFKAGEQFEANVLVKLSAGVITVAALTEPFIGVALRKASAAGDIIPVRLRNSAGSVEILSAGPVAEAAIVYGRAAGKVDDVSTSSALRVGTAVKPVSAANELVEVVMD